VLLPAPDERPALRIYQEAGQFLGGLLSVWCTMVFIEKPVFCDSKTGSHFCSEIMQNRFFAYKIGNGVGL
jgi:hypothetical protein